MHIYGRIAIPVHVVQTTGEIQGNNLKPLLISVQLKERLREFNEKDLAKGILYADYVKSTR